MEESFRYLGCAVVLHLGVQGALQEVSPVCWISGSISTMPIVLNTVWNTASFSV